MVARVRILMISAILVVAGLLVPTTAATAAVATPRISLGPDVVVGENVGFVNVSVTLSAPGTSPVSMYFNTSNGTAVAGADYSCPLTACFTGTLTFAPGEVAKAIRVPITNDTTKEPPGILRRQHLQPGQRHHRPQLRPRQHRRQRHHRQHPRPVRPRRHRRRNRRHHQHPRHHGRTRRQSLRQHSHRALRHQQRHRHQRHRLHRRHRHPHLHPRPNHPEHPRQDHQRHHNRNHRSLHRHPERTHQREPGRRHRHRHHRRQRRHPRRRPPHQHRTRHHRR